MTDPEAYELQKFDKDGNLWIYWNGWYKIPYESVSNPFRGIIPKEYFKGDEDEC